MQTGKVKFFNEEKGFGFIVPENGSKDLFVHISGVKNGVPLKEDSKVEYEVGQGKKGPCAIEVTQVQ